MANATDFTNESDAQKIMKIYEGDDFEVGFKKDDSPLTKADLASHHLILDHLKKTEISVLSEEGKENHSAVGRES